MNTAYPEESRQNMYQNRDVPTTTVRRYEAVTPSDATEFSPWFRALRIGGAGDIVVTDIEGNDVTFVGAQVGETLPIWGSKVKAATTATDIIAYFG